MGPGLGFSRSLSLRPALGGWSWHRRAPPSRGSPDSDGLGQTQMESNGLEQTRTGTCIRVRTAPLLNIPDKQMAAATRGGGATRTGKTTQRAWRQRLGDSVDGDLARRAPAARASAASFLIFITY